MQPKPRRRLLLLPLCLVALALPACYQQTISASGMGASRHRVQESQRSNTAADRAFDSLFGTEPKSTSRWQQPPSTPRAQPPGPRPVTAGKQAPKN
jgi:hypothetical protein